MRILERIRGFLSGGFGVWILWIVILIFRVIVKRILGAPGIIWHAASRRWKLVLAADSRIYRILNIGRVGVSWVFSRWFLVRVVSVRISVVWIFRVILSFRESIRLSLVGRGARA